MELFLSISLFILGALLGSFVGLISERAFTGQSWKSGRSRCNSCREQLHTRDLIPILSWMLHRGRCRTCGSRVPGMYVIYEATLGTLFVVSLHFFGLTLPLIPFLAAITLLSFIVIYDLRHTIVPPPASTALSIIAGLFALTVSSSLSNFLFTVAYAAGIGLFFFCLYFFSKGRAMGLGDTPIAFALALLAGHQALAGLLFSFWIGGAIGIVILVLRRGGPKMGIEVPFVPFMAAGFLLALFTQWNPLPF